MPPFEATVPRASGGKGGGPEGERNGAYRTGRYTAEAKAERQGTRALLRELRRLIEAGDKVSGLELALFDASAVFQLGQAKLPRSQGCQPTSAGPHVCYCAEPLPAQLAIESSTCLAGPR
jgi:hypothetical protein